MTKSRIVKVVIMKKVSKNVLLRNLGHCVGDTSTVAEPSLDEDCYDYSKGNNIEYSTSAMSKKYVEIKKYKHTTHYF